MVTGRKVNVNPIFRKIKREKPGIYRTVSLTSIPGKVVEQPTLENISSHNYQE